MQTELARALEAYRTPVEGSRRAVDARWMEGEGSDRAAGLGEVLNWGVIEIAELFRVVEEYASGVELLLGHDEPLPVPLMSLVRSV